MFKSHHTELKCIHIQNRKNAELVSFKKTLAVKTRQTARLAGSQTKNTQTVKCNFFLKAVCPICTGEGMHIHS
jgi:hypothetical protein